MIKAIVAGVDYYQKGDFKYYLSETNNLCEAANMEVVANVTQKLERIHPRTYFGKGKIAELAELVAEHDIEVVIFNDELSGSQNRNIENIIDCKVMDRTELILRIFDARAQTKEARLQVGIALLQYQKPRMIGSYEGMDRQGGGGPINRGSGETKLEQDQRKIDAMIAHKREELDKILKARENQRRKRNANDIPVVAIVGYTNAGKSTLMNSLVQEDKQVFEKDMLFATLDTSTRNIKYEHKDFLLVDTVGFVSKLPHNLVSAFRSTLEEVQHADLIIHLSDLSDPNYVKHIDVVNETLKMIECEEIPKILVYNKCDLTDVEVEGLKISARKRFNLNVLQEQVCNEIFKDYQFIEFELQYDQIGILNILRNKYSIIDETFAETITFKIHADKNRLQKNYLQYIK